MRRLLRASLAVAAISGAAGGIDQPGPEPSRLVESHAGLKKRLAVMDMSLAATTTGTSSAAAYSQTTTLPVPPPSDFAAGLTEMLTTELGATGRFIVLERKALADATAEQDLVAAGRINPETGAKGGGIIGAQALVRAAVTEYAYSQSSTGGSLKVIQGLSLGAKTLRAVVGIDTRVYDARTSEVLASVVARGSATSSGADVKYADDKVDVGFSGFRATPLGRASRQAIEEAVRFIVRALGNVAWEARVVRAQDGLVYLNAGSESGLAAGQAFDVYRPGEPLVDPASGKLLGTPDRRIATVTVTSAAAQYAVSRIASGETPARNDVVRPAGSGESP